MTRSPARPEGRSPARAAGSPAAPGWHRAAGAVSLGLHGVVLVLPYAFTGLVAPPSGVVAALVLWAALLGVGVVLLRRRPLLVAAVPVAAVLLWLLLVTVGDALLGWTA